jgi:hypothetical protein
VLGFDTFAVSDGAGRFTVAPVAAGIASMEVSGRHSRRSTTRSSRKLRPPAGLETRDVPVARESTGGDLELICAAGRRG